MAGNDNEWAQQINQAEKRLREPGGTQRSTVILKALVLLMGLYLFLCGFVLSVCVFMSNSDLSPEISLDFGHHPVKSILLMVLVAIPFVLMVVMGRAGVWGWICLRLFAATVAIVGAYALIAPNGALQGLTGTDDLRHGTGIVYIVSSLIVLLISVIPGLRRRIAEGF